jgi:hypothetical protein
MEDHPPAWVPNIGDGRLVLGESTIVSGVRRARNGLGGWIWEHIYVAKNYKRRSVVFLIKNIVLIVQLSMQIRYNVSVTMYKFV